MAAPTLTWKQVTGAPPYSGATKTTLVDNTLDYGSVQAGSNSSVLAVIATVSGANISSEKFWLYDKTANKGDVGAASGWGHKGTVKTQANYTEASGMTFTDLATLGETPETGMTPGDTLNGNDTDVIYLGVTPPSSATDGEWNSWGYRLSFLYSS